MRHGSSVSHSVAGQWSGNGSVATTWSARARGVRPPSVVKAVPRRSDAVTRLGGKLGRELEALAASDPPPRFLDEFDRHMIHGGILAAKRMAEACDHNGESLRFLEKIRRAGRNRHIPRGRIGRENDDG